MRTHTLVAIFQLDAHANFKVPTTITPIWNWFNGLYVFISDYFIENSLNFVGLSNLPDADTVENRTAYASLLSKMDQLSQSRGRIEPDWRASKNGTRSSQINCNRLLFTWINTHCLSFQCPTKLHLAMNILAVRGQNAKSDATLSSLPY